MAEREQLGLQPAGLAAEPESIDVRRLPHLISGAQASKGGDRRALALEINRVLIAMRGPGHEEAESQLIVSALDDHSLDGLVDEGGHACRKEAVETLLACGFPHALKISHEDLVFARTYQPGELDGSGHWKDPLRRARRNGAAVVLGGELLFLLILLATAPVLVSHPGLGSLVALSSGFAAALLSVLFALADPKVEGQSAWGTTLAMCAVAQLLSATSVGPPALLGGVGIIFGLLVAFAAQYGPRADPPKPGDWDSSG